MIQFTSADVAWPKYVRAMVAGHPGTGKTTWAASAPKPLIINCNAGLAALAGMNLPFISVDSLSELSAALKIANGEEDETGKSVEVETVVIDSVDDLQRRVMKRRLKSVNRDHPDFEDWGWIAEQFNNVFEATRKLKANFIVTARMNMETELPAISGQFAHQIHNYIDYAFEARRPDYDHDVVISTWRAETSPSNHWTHTLLDPTESYVSFESLGLQHAEKRDKLELVAGETTEITDHDNATEIAQKVLQQQETD